MGRRTALKMLAGLRMTLGAASWIAPRLAGGAGGRGGYLPKLTSALVTRVALSAAAPGAAALGQE